MPRVAIVLSGCGVFDGSEIHEGVSLMLHLSRHGVEYRSFAPNREQMHVVNHLTGQPAPEETRNVLVESARIARGEIAPLDTLNVNDFDALFLPGGFGAAKNLSDFATRGTECSIEPGTERVLREFQSAGKPIGMCCIAPVIAARVFGASGGCSVTIGNDPETAGAIETMGAVHQDRPVTEACVDEANHLVTAPAYMYADAPIHAVYDGIGEMVEKTLELIGAGVR